MALRADLQKHILIAPFCAGLGGLLASMANREGLVSIAEWVGALALLIAATAGKEIVWDGLLKRGTRAWDDLLAGMASGLVVVAAIYVAG